MSPNSRRPSVRRSFIFGLMLSALLLAGTAGLTAPSYIADSVSPGLSKSPQSFALSDAPLVPDLNVPDAPTARARLRETYGQLPLSFEANQGQADPRIKFLSRGPGYNLLLTADEAVLQLRKEVPAARSRKAGNGNGKSSVLRMKFTGGDPAPRVSGVDESGAVSNYLIGGDPTKWRTNVPNYRAVRYGEVYPGIDVVFYDNQRELEYDFVVAPGADPNAIKLAFSGNDRLEIDEDGGLLLSLRDGTVRQSRPVIYQEAAGLRREVEGGYRITRGGEVAFRVGAYDRTRPLVIDPVLIYSTFLGGGNGDSGEGIAVDGAGNAYVMGDTASLNFPVTPNAPQPAYGGDGDVFVAKLNSAGSALIYSTYLGGSGSDDGWGIAVDGAGNAYVTGFTGSTNFPVTPGAFQPFNAGNGDAFVAKLNSMGSALTYSTYLGGSSNDQGFAVAVDGAGDAYVTGGTFSNFSVTPGAVQPVNGGSQDVFVAKLNVTGSALVYSTYLGGLSQESGRGIAVDGAGNAYVTGSTSSLNFPATPGAFQPVKASNTDAFVTKLNSTGTALVYSTHLGGSAIDLCHAIAIDSTGNAYVAGLTTSPNFPVTPGAFQPANGGGADAVVTKLNSAGSALIYSTHLGGGNFERGEGIAVDGAGHAYVVGLTTSPNFPVTPNVPQPAYAGEQDAFVTKLNVTGTALVYSTYLGSDFIDEGNAIAVDGAGNAYATGFNGSSNFPVTPNAFQPVSNNGDAFVVKIGEANSDGDDVPDVTDNCPLVTNPDQADADGDARGDACDNCPNTSNAVQADADGDQIGDACDTAPNCTGIAPPGASGNWQPRANVSAPRFALAAADLNGTLHALGGTSGFCDAFALNEAYDAATNTWTTRAPLPTPRFHLDAASLNGKLYAVGGATTCGGESAANQAYDPVTNTWASRAPLPSPRIGLRVAAAGGRLYAMGGQGGGAVRSEVWEYDPAANTWTPKASMPFGRSLFGVGVVNDRIYVVGGYDPSFGLAAPVHIYDPATNGWSTGAPMPTLRVYNGAAALGGLVYALGGYPSGPASAIVEAYDPATNTWSSKPPMLTPRAEFGAAAAGGKLYAVGGGSGAPMSSVEAFTPTGMTNWWPGDGNAFDIRGGQHGTLLRGAGFATGLVGQAFSFDGVDDFVRVEDSNVLRVGTGEVTLDAWIKAPPGNTPRAIAAKVGLNFPFAGYALRITDDNRLDFFAVDCGTGSCGFGVTRLPLSGTSIVADDTFHHVAGVRRADGTLEVYVDGVLEASRLDPLWNTDNADPFTIGEIDAGPLPEQPFAGIIDEVELFNRALLASEIQALYNAGSAGKCKSATDADGDGVPNNTDNCPLVANTDQSDNDSDGQGDACDPDDDNDTVADGADNCPLNANTDQVNTDGDALGDICDPDDDNDGIADGADNCSLTPNADQANNDGDASGDVCDSDDDDDTVPDTADNCPLITNPDQSNTDNDAQGDACDPDDDNDGVADASDNCPLTSNPDQANNDGDAQGDVCDPDDDNDGIADGADNCPFSANAGQLDNDSDGQGDACDADDDNDAIADAEDNCPLVSNAGQANNDGDAQGDACDADDDNDAVADGTDNCPFVANADQANNDADAEGDVCDPDDDNDNVPDANDNCPLVANPAQTDTDDDGQGDACDADDDGDGVVDASDNCQFAANPDQANNDGDAQGDVCDADDDNDGLPDTADNCQLNANPDQADADGDGQGDACDTDDDNDGVPDGSDQCAGTPAGTPVNAFGCPLPTNKDQCKNGGWQAFFRADGTPFKNQGDCIEYVNTGK